MCVFIVGILGRGCQQPGVEAPLASSKWYCFWQANLTVRQHLATYLQSILLCEIVGGSHQPWGVGIAPPTPCRLFPDEKACAWKKEVTCLDSAHRGQSLLYAILSMPSCSLRI